MKTPTEAYYFTMEKVFELKDQGIEISIIPCKSRNNPETVKKFSKPERILPEYWVQVRFKTITPEQNKKVYEMNKYLFMCGIYFDNGGCKGGRDWELDWSFTYHKGEENWESIMKMEEVEDLIKKMNNE
jgi:hypothetical protein